MAPKTVNCPRCKTQLDISSFPPGSRIKCGACQAGLRLPGAPAVAPVSAPVSTSRPGSNPASGSGSAAGAAMAPTRRQQAPVPAPIPAATTRMPASAPSADPDFDPLIGKTVGEEFEITKKLGEGGYGAVYEAVDRTLRRKVAVKMMLATRASNKEYVSKFLREARTAAQLSHPNVVAIHQVGFDRDQRTHYLAMEYVEGRTLHDILQERGPLGVDEAVDIMSQCCRGLEAAHRKNIIHRDIKPGNIMITPSGGVKIADFGLAKVFDADEQAKSMVIGTPFFMPPEQFEGKAKDGRTDIYALGVTFYYMLTLKRPFTGSTPAQILVSIMTKDPKPVTEERPELPVAIWDVVRKMIHRDLDLRYQDCGAILTDLQALRKPDEAEKIYCPACGLPNEPDADQCRGCAASMRERCPVCGAEEAIGVKFCGDCGANVPVEREVKTLADEGKVLVESGDFTAAIERLRQAQERSPENSEVASLLREAESRRDQKEHERTACSALLASGDFDRAEERIAAALELYPEDEHLLALKGDLERTREASKTGQGRSTVESLLRARRYSEAREAAERLMMSEGPTPELKALLEQAREVLRSIDEGVRQARDLETRGSRTPALEAWRQVLEISPDFREARKAVRRLEGALGEIDGALDMARKMLDAGDPEEAVARLNDVGERALDDQRVKELQEEALGAVETLRKEASRIRGLLQSGATGDAAGALPSLKERFSASTLARDLDRDIAAAMAMEKRGERMAALHTLREGKRWTELRDGAASLIESDPEAVEAGTLRAEAEEALRCLTEVVERARAAEAGGLLEDAAKEWATARDIAPAEAEVVAGVARVADLLTKVSSVMVKASFTADPVAASALYHEVLELVPGHPAATAALADLERRLTGRTRTLEDLADHMVAGRIAEARAELEKFEKEFPGDAEAAEVRSLLDTLTLCADEAAARARRVAAMPGREAEAARWADIASRILPGHGKG